MIDHDTLSRLKNFLLLTAGVMLTLSSCDDSFQPLQENDKFNFSIQGYLNASADTQWVRVGTIRPTIDELPDPEGIHVTLTDLESGETVVMNDSLFSTRGVLNYWTTMDIKHEKTYRITAENTDGKSSRVTVTTPAELPAVYITAQESGFSGVQGGARIYIDDSVEHIADLQSVWYVIINPRTENRRRIFKFPLRNTLSHTDAYFGSYVSFANWQSELAQIRDSVGGAQVLVVYRQIFVVAGGPEWDENLSSIVDLEYFLIHNASNVEDGLGYVVGVSSKWFRQFTCFGPDGSNTGACKPEEPFWTKE